MCLSVVNDVYRHHLFLEYMIFLSNMFLYYHLAILKFIFPSMVSKLVILVMRLSTNLTKSNISGDWLWVIDLSTKMNSIDKWG